MSDAYNRHLLNNLASAAGTRYLEVGVEGSTLVSVLAGEHHPPTTNDNNNQEDMRIFAFRPTAGNEPMVDRAIAVDVWDWGLDEGWRRRGHVAANSPRGVQA